MNEAEIENLLRKSPRLNTPKDLEKKLREDIRLPRVASSQSIESTIGFSWKRWLPAAICVAFALTAVTVQFKTLARLEKENAALQSATQNLEQLRRENAGLRNALLANADLQRLRREHGELLNLQAEISQLRIETAGIDSLRAENKLLETSLIASANATNDFFAEQQARAERATCVNNLKQIGLAARIWAGDNEDIHPPDFISMTNELGTPKVLICPTDKSRKAGTWADAAAGNVSYRMDAPGIKMEEDASVVFVHCPIHHSFCLVDGSVQTLDEEGMKKHLKVINGRKVFVHRNEN